MFEPISHRTIFDRIDKEKQWLARYEDQIMQVVFEPCSTKTREKALYLQKEAHELRRTLCELEDYLDSLLARAFGCYEKSMEVSLTLNGELYLLRHQMNRDPAA